ncbi:MAG: hypothetical protein C0497_05200 [Gemmatimonas sp.]|nr:hypothetical protein [Gemmatimonas sp.]
MDPSPILEAVLKRLSCILPVLLLSSALAAQEPRGQHPRMPDAFTPPAGLCRLWISGVPASQQPAPTDCANAVKNRPSNAAVVFGPPVRIEAKEIEPFSRRSGRLNERQAVSGARSEGRDEALRDELRSRPADAARTDLRARPAAATRDEPQTRAAETPVKAVPRKPEKPQ